MTNQNLFKEAIADAKQVREAALATAKAALTEALTPKLQSMLAAKLEEIDNNDELDENKETELEEDIDLSSILSELDDEVEDSTSVDETKDEDETAEEAAEETDDDAAEDETTTEDEKVKDISVEDLKTIIRDIVAAEMGGGAGEEAPGDDTMDMGDMGGNEMPGADNDEVDLEELLAELDALSEEKDEELDEAKKKKVDDKKKDDKKDDKKELDEAIKVINILRKELNEVNLLNAKLLYVNKIFKAKNLNESQKLKVISAFDKATTPKEAKVVFESLNTGLTSNPKKTIKESLGFASKPAGNAPNKNIVETDEVITRWQKLANIK